jgi:hypothetical protein
MYFELYNQWGEENYLRHQNVSFEIMYKPTNALSISVQPSLAWRFHELEYVSTEENEAGEKSYVFADIEQNTFALNIRFSYSITPDLTIQYYGQPFISAGEYSNYKRITNPRAGEYSDRFHLFSWDEYQTDTDGNIRFDENGNGLYDYEIDNPDFNVQFFLSNLVVRWEYRPGSTLYLVWSQNREGTKSTGTFNLNDDMRDLYAVQPHNILLLKLSYWFPLL